MYKRGWIILVIALICISSAIAYEILEEKETKTIIFDGKEAELSVITISEIQKAVLFKLNEKYFLLKPGERYEGEGIAITLRDMIATGKSTQKSIARIDVSRSYTTNEKEELPAGPNIYEIKGTIVNANPYFYNIEFEDEYEKEYISEEARTELLKIISKTEENNILEELKNASKEQLRKKYEEQKPTKVGEEKIPEVQKPSEPAKIFAEIKLAKLEMNYEYSTILIFIILIIIGIAVIKKLGIKHIKPKITLKKRIKKDKKNRKKK